VANEEQREARKVAKLAASKDDEESRFRSPAYIEDHAVRRERLRKRRRTKTKAWNLT
jgi:hypothetical protein